MIRRWTHVHTLATGLVFGLVLDREALIVFGLGLVLGVAIVIGWRQVRRLAGWGRETAQHAAHGLEELRQAEADRKRAAAEELRTRAQNRLRRAAEQVEAERRAYLAGARDGDRPASYDDGERPGSLLGIDLEQYETNGRGLSHELGFEVAPAFEEGS